MGRNAYQFHIMKRALNLKSLALIVAALLANSSSFAQFGATPPGMDPSLTKLFGQNTAFSAGGQVAIQVASQNQPMNVDMKVSMLEGKMRMEMDMSKLAGPGPGSQLRLMGMDQVVFISLPEKKMVLQVYPGLQGYMETTMPAAQAAGATKDYKIEKASLGKETIDAHACEKNKVTMTDDKGEKHEFVVWNAADLKDFPLRFQTTEQGNTITVNYRDVKLDKPDAKLFEAPAGFTKYGSQMDLMQAVMARKTPGGPRIK